MLLLGYFEGLDSERAIAWRAADSLSIRSFLGLELHEAAPDHSTVSRTRVAPIRTGGSHRNRQQHGRGTNGDAAGHVLSAGLSVSGTVTVSTPSWKSVVTSVARTPFGSRVERVNL
jgi:hypothetical protein